VGCIEKRNETIHQATWDPQNDFWKELHGLSRVVSTIIFGSPSKLPSEDAGQRIAEASEWKNVNVQSSDGVLNNSAI
jgi:hypothetical protein